MVFAVCYGLDLIFPIFATSAGPYRPARMQSTSENRKTDPEVFLCLLQICLLSVLRLSGSGKGAPAPDHRANNSTLWDSFSRASQILHWNKIYWIQRQVCHRSCNLDRPPVTNPCFGASSRWLFIWLQRPRHGLSSGSLTDSHVFFWAFA